MPLVFDIETNGYLDATSVVHCLSTKDTESGLPAALYPPDAVEDGLRHLMKYAGDGGTIVGHNVIAFDIPAIQKVYPWFDVPKSSVFDTLVASRLLWADINDKDAKMAARGRLPPKLIGRHSLEAWGHRLGEYKGDFEGPWEQYTDTMGAYCQQDAEATAKLWHAVIKRAEGALEPRAEALVLEHRVRWIVARQERNGFTFNKPAAQALYAKLAQRRLELLTQLTVTFPQLYISAGLFTPKRDNKTRCYTADCPLTKVTLTAFNPSSRDHVAFWLKRMHGWEPSEFTKDGKARIDDVVLSDLEYPEAKLLAEYFMVEKRIGQVAEGNQAWLKLEKNGRIHGSIITNGAVTGRMTHFNPNIAQVPTVAKPYGAECRALFGPRKGMVLVGCDADALELRDLAGYMAIYDDGAYIATVLEGKKEEGTDLHTVNCRALGMDPKAPQWNSKPGREVAKTWFYAFIYGAGDEKLGFILTGQRNKALNVSKGKKARASFLKNLPAMGKLVEKVRTRAKDRGYLIGLDGRHLAVRSQHAALNTLLQSAGAVQMKKALVILDEHLQDLGRVPGVDYEFVANIHDEFQIECRPEIAEEVGTIAAESIRLAGEQFNFRCPLKGNYVIGANWAETH